MERKEVAAEPEPASGETRTSFLAVRTGVGILIHDATNRRLVEAASMQLDLLPLSLNDTSLTRESLAGLELIIADTVAAVRIRSILSADPDWENGMNPALIAVVPPETQSPDSLVQAVDALLVLPQPPTEVAAKLSLILYAQRGLAKRYKTALEELFLSKQIFQSVTAGITVADATVPAMPLTYVNPAFEVMTGYKFEEIQGGNCRFLQGDDRDQSAILLIREALREQRGIVTLLKNYRKDGTPFWNELSLSPVFNRDGVLTHFVGIQVDVSGRVEAELALAESQKLLTEANEKLMRLSVTDPLTGLKNRRAFDDRLEYELSSVKRSRKPSTLVLLDIDHFKQVNDKFGHLAGDEVLCELAELLQKSLRENDTAARFGGEEFGIFLSGVSPVNAMAWVRRFYSLLSQALWRYCAITVSMGIAEITAEIQTASEVVWRADEALYRAKREGRARAVVHSSGE